MGRVFGKLLSLAVLVVALCSSCRGRGQKGEPQPKPAEPVAEEVYEEIPIPEPVSTPVTPLDGFRYRDSVVFDRALLDLYYESGAVRPLTVDMYDRLDVEALASFPLYSPSVVVMDSIALPGRDYFIRLFGQDEGSRATIWMANYGRKDLSLIDSRRVYHSGPDSYGGPGDREGFYTVTYPSRDRMEVRRTSILFGQVKMPLVVRHTGRFEEMPEMPYRNDTVSIGLCRPNLLDGKHLLGRAWTVLWFDDDGLYTDTGVTQNIYVDDAGNTGTLLYNPETEYLHFDIAFRGAFPAGYFERLPLAVEDIEDHSDMAALALTWLRDQPGPEGGNGYDKGDGEYRTDIRRVNSYTTSGGKYFFVEVVEGAPEYMMPVLVGISPSMEFELLGPRCTGNYYLLRMGEDIFTCVMRDSCGEGAWKETFVFKMADGFTPVYRGRISCD